MSSEESKKRRRAEERAAVSERARPSRVPFVDLSADYARVRDDVAKRFERVLASQTFVLGEQTLALEQSIRELVGTRHAVGCSSGTDALSLALAALGVGAGDVVLVPSFTFFATAGAVVRAGAEPVFVDVDERSFLAGPGSYREALDREFDLREGRWVRRRDRRPLRAAVVVHLFGEAADCAGVRVATGGDVALIEDAAQALGARRGGAAVGSTGDVGCFSFYPTKNLGAAGDAGIVTASDDELGRALRALRVHGAGTDRYVHEWCGFNARIDELQAAYLNAKLPLLDEFTCARRRIAAAYRERLSDLAGRELIALPAQGDELAHVWHQFVVRVPAQRDEVLQRMTTDGVDARVFYPLPLHLQPAFATLGYQKGDFPRAERLASEVLSLPLYPSLADSTLDRVCTVLARALER